MASALKNMTKRDVRLQPPEKFYLVTVYTPNAKRDLSRLAYRQVWEDDFLIIKKLEETKPVIFCGDLNVAHKEIGTSESKDKCE